MYDKLIIERHLQALLRDLDNLEKYRNISKEDFKQNLDLIWILERGIYLCIQNIFDVFSHIVSSELNKQWDSYSDIAMLLYDAQKIDKEERDLLIKMAGFRNRLSHDYLGLDVDVIIDIVSNKLDDLKAFARIIAQYT